MPRRGRREGTDSRGSPVPEHGLDEVDVPFDGPLVLFHHAPGLCSCDLSGRVVDEETFQRRGEVFDPGYRQAPSGCSEAPGHLPAALHMGAEKDRHPPCGRFHEVVPAHRDEASPDKGRVAHAVTPEELPQGVEDHHVHRALPFLRAPEPCTKARAPDHVKNIARTGRMPGGDEHLETGNGLSGMKKGLQDDLFLARMGASRDQNGPFGFKAYLQCKFDLLVEREVRERVVVLEISQDLDPLRGDADSNESVPILLRLHDNVFEATVKESGQGTYAGDKGGGTGRNASVDEGRLYAAGGQVPDPVWPDIRLDEDEAVRADLFRDASHGKGYVKGRWKDGRDHIREAGVQGSDACFRRTGADDGVSAPFFSAFSCERDCGIGLSYRKGVDPDSGGLAFRPGDLGDEPETFPKTGKRAVEEIPNEEGRSERSGKEVIKEKGRFHRPGVGPRVPAGG